MDPGLRIAVLKVPILGVCLIQKAWWMLAVNLMVLASSEALLFKTTCASTKEIFELDALNLFQLPMTIGYFLNNTCINA